MDRMTRSDPLFFRSGTCNVPSQFLAGCIPAILPGANPWAQSKSNFDPNQPLLNVSAFESANNFNFYYGQGPRISNLRGFGYHNQDMGLIKNTNLTERVSVQFRAEAFNVFNHTEFRPPASSSFFSGTFGQITGTYDPRIVQLALKLTF